MQDRHYNVDDDITDVPVSCTLEETASSTHTTPHARLYELNVDSMTVLSNDTGTV